MTLVEWLQSRKGVSNVRAFTVVIKGTTYQAARYVQTIPIAPSCPAYARGEREHTHEMLYVLGALPRHYVRSSRAAYVVADDNREWYIAGYYAGAKDRTFHPFGAHFLLTPWDAPDKHEQRPYARIPLGLTPA